MTPPLYLVWNPSEGIDLGFFVIRYYSLMFVIAFGFSLLQIVANPFVINLGDPAKGSFRLNLAGSINSLGTSLGPVIFGFALFGSPKSAAVTNIGIEAVKLPFIILSVVLVGVALFSPVLGWPSLVRDGTTEE